MIYKHLEMGVADARIQQDAHRRLFVGNGPGVPFAIAEDRNLTLAEIPSSYVQHGVPDANPNNALLPHLVQQKPRSSCS